MRPAVFILVDDEANHLAHAALLAADALVEDLRGYMMPPAAATDDANDVR